MLVLFGPTRRGLIWSGFGWTLKLKSRVDFATPVVFMLVFGSPKTSTDQPPPLPFHICKRHKLHPSRLSRLLAVQTAQKGRHLGVLSCTTSLFHHCRRAVRCARPILWPSAVPSHLHHLRRHRHHLQTPLAAQRRPRRDGDVTSVLSSGRSLLCPGQRAPSDPDVTFTGR